jgi:hypothetical protein
VGGHCQSPLWIGEPRAPELSSCQLWIKYHIRRVSTFSRGAYLVLDLVLDHNFADRTRQLCARRHTCFRKFLPPHDVTFARPQPLLVIYPMLRLCSLMYSTVHFFLWSWLASWRRCAVCDFSSSIWFMLCGWRAWRLLI